MLINEFKRLARMITRIAEHCGDQLDFRGGCTVDQIWERLPNSRLDNIGDVHDALKAMEAVGLIEKVKNSTNERVYWRAVE